MLFRSQSRIDSARSEIARLEKASNDAFIRVDEAKRECARLEMDVAGLDAGELGLDADFEKAKSALSQSRSNLENLNKELARAEREKSAAEATVDALRQATLHKDGSGALLTNTRGIEIRGSVASLISVEPGWEKAVSAALGSIANALVVHDATHAISALTFLKSESAEIGRAHV